MAIMAARLKAKEGVAGCVDPRNTPYYDQELRDELVTRFRKAAGIGGAGSYEDARQQGMVHLYTDAHGGCKAVKWGDEQVRNGTSVSVNKLTAVVSYLQNHVDMSKEPSPEQLNEEGKIANKRAAKKLGEELGITVEPRFIDEDAMIKAAGGTPHAHHEVVLMPSRLNYAPAFKAASIGITDAYVTQLFRPAEIVAQVELAVEVLGVAPSKVVLIARDPVEAKEMGDMLRPAIAEQPFMQGVKPELVEAF